MQLNQVKVFGNAMQTTSARATMRSSVGGE